MSEGQKIKSEPLDGFSLTYPLFRRVGLQILPDFRENVRRQYLLGLVLVTAVTLFCHQFSGLISQENFMLLYLVSDMGASATGASMVLDVPRILASIDGQLGASTAMFLYTSEVFEGIPPQARRGVEANGLAMMGELLATSMGASEADSELLGMLGINPPNTPTMYRRIFPIGSKHGLQGATFGDGKLESIYRAVGVALAGLTASASAVDAFRTRDLGNPSPTPLDERWMGEGGSAGGDPLLWGTFGYARLSLGRDRYGEYVAQRLSRVAVDRLIAGHRDDRGQTSAEMDLTEATDEATRRLIANLGLSPETTDAIALISRQSVGGGEGTRQELIRSMREVAWIAISSRSCPSTPI